MTDRPEAPPAAPVRPRSRREVPLGSALVVVGLMSVALAQPLLDLLGRNPQFFVAGRYTGSQIVLFGIVVTFVPALVAALLILVSHWLHPRLGRGVYLVLVAVLGAAIANLIVRSLGLDADAVAAVATLSGAAAAVAVQRPRAGRLLLQYLAAANLLFLGAFLLMSPTSRLLGTSDADRETGRVHVPPIEGPVVVVILDELPLTTLLRDDGTINAERFPRFAELSERSTWFRNASSRHNLTDVAVPTLLTGVVASSDELPDHHDHPKNLFTLFGRDVPVYRQEVVTDLCPSSVSAPESPQPLTTAIEDAAVVYGHRLLPARFSGELPAIDHAWGDFGADLGGGGVEEPDPEGRSPDGDGFARWKALGLQEKSAPRQAEIFLDRVDRIEAEPSLHLIHVALPHYPWILTPWGNRLMEFPKRVDDPADPAFDWSTRSSFQLHSMQTGAADVALGALIDHLDALGVWDETTLVVASDHGLSLLPPDFSRTATDQNRQELFRVPLFIHAPGLEPGVRDEPAQLIDVIPTLVDLLGAEVDWSFDGHSLVDGSDARLEPIVGSSLAPALEVVARHQAQVPRGWDWNTLAAVGEHGDLVGRSLDDLRIGRRSEMRWTPDNEALIGTLPAPGGKVPQLLTGVVESDERPPELVVAVNGTIAGTIGGYLSRDGSWRFTAFLGPYLRDGPNTFEAFEVVGAGDEAVLEPLG